MFNRKEYVAQIIVILREFKKLKRNKARFRRYGYFR